MEVERLAYRGFVEVHNVTGVSGWCVDAETPGQSVLLTCVCEGIELRKIFTSMERADIKRGHGADRAGFRFWIGDSLHRLLPAKSTVQVLLPDGTPLPVLKPESVSFVGAADDGGAELRRRLAAGQVIDKWGQIKRPFSAMDARLRRRHMDGMIALDDYFARRLGYRCFPHYGTLLGFARHGEFLPHDDDVDMSFIVRSSSVDDVALEFFRVVKTIAADGHHVSVTNTGQMHARLSDAEMGADVFVSWLTPQLEFFTYFGVGGRLSKVPLFTEAELEGRTILVPDCHEEILAATYGPQWLVPDPHFQWHRPAWLEARMAALEAAGKPMLDSLPNLLASGGEEG